MAFQADMSHIEGAGMQGALDHLKKAAEYLNDGKSEDSIRESIHAVESIVCTISKEPKSPLNSALKKLKANGIEIHPAFLRGLEKIYAYTSDERGIRHSSLGEDIKVDHADAQFMFGSCASFCAFLVEKARVAKLL